MFDKKQKRCIMKANEWMAKSGQKYVFMVMDKTEEKPKSYFSIYSDFSDAEIVFFTRFLLQAMHRSGTDYLPEGQKPDPDEIKWMESIMEQIKEKNASKKEPLTINMGDK